MTISVTQWRNANDKGKYPFSTLATMTNGSLIVPDTLFTDARFYPVGNSQELYMSSVVKTPTDITLNFSTEKTTNLASTTYTLSSLPDKLRVLDKFGREAGVIVTSATRLAPLNGWPEGNHNFTADQTPFAAVAVTPVPESGVFSLRTDDTELLEGDVYLVGGAGVQLSVDMLNPGGPAIEVHLDGEPLFKQLVCSTLGFDIPCFLRTINGNDPDAFGDFKIGVCGIDSTNTIIRVIPTTSGLQITTAGRTGGR